VVQPRRQRALIAIRVVHPRQRSPLGVPGQWGSTSQRQLAASNAGIRACTKAALIGSQGQIK
jgi:hypothetical protein